MPAESTQKNDWMLDEPIAAFWPVNVLLIGLGAAVLTTAFVFLDPLDPRPAYNPWTYAIATPIALLLLSAILGMLVSRKMEKTMQVAFLLSVLVHLLLLAYAMNVVIFSRMWPKMFDAAVVERHRLEQQQLRARQYYQFSSARRNEAEPEYRRSVPTEFEAREVEVADAPALQLARSTAAHLVTPVPRLQRDVASHLIERKSEAIPASVSELLPAELSRSQSQTSPREADRVDVPLVPADAEAGRRLPDDATLERRQDVRSAPRLAAAPDLQEPAGMRPEPEAAALVPAPPVTPSAPPPPAVPRRRLGRSPAAAARVDAPLMAAADDPGKSAVRPQDSQVAVRRSPAGEARVAPSVRVELLPPSDRLAQRAAPAASIQSGGLPQSGDIADRPERFDVAGGRLGGLPAATMPVIGEVSIGTASPRPAPLPAPDTALSRSSLVGRARGAVATLGAMSAETWTKEMRVEFGAELRGGLQPAASGGQAAATDVAALFGAGKVIERSVAGPAAPPGGTVVPPVKDPGLASGTAEGMVAPGEPLDRPSSQRGSRSGGFDAVAVLSLEGVSGPEAGDGRGVSADDLLEQGLGRLALATGSSDDRGDDAAAADGGRAGAPTLGRTRGTGGAPPALVAGVPTVEVPGPGGTGQDATTAATDKEGADLETLADASEHRRRGRQGTGGPVAPLRLHIDAPPGTGGIDVAADAIGSLLARNELRMHPGPQTELRTQRFPRAELGGPLTAGAPAASPTPAFEQRLNRLRDPSAAEHMAVEPQTELAIERGLEFLARHQRPDGSWRLQDFDTRVLIRSDTAATGLALLAFQGAGYTHRDFKYADVVGKAIDFLRAHQQPDGDLYVRQDPASDQNAWLYSHALAALALTEAYGMTQDPEIRPVAQRAVDFIAAAQDVRRGGWRYRPGAGSDTSVSGWFMMALQSARLAGLDAPSETIHRLRDYLELSQAGPEQPYLYRYNPFAPDTPQQRHGLQPTPVMTSVGLLMRLYLGWRRDQPAMQAGADYLLQHLPENGTADQPQRDTYYWYYATQVIFHVGGDHWRIWHDRLYPLLISSQVVDGPMAGSWHPELPAPDLWGRWGGRLYVTTMNLLSLEVSYRHLPLYDATAQ